jgi:hypothetical protein
MLSKAQQQQPPWEGDLAASQQPHNSSMEQQPSQAVATLQQKQALQALAQTQQQQLLQLLLQQMQRQQQQVL